MRFFSGVFLAATLAALPFLASAHDSCSKPSVRKEWRALTTQEQTDWLSAYKCLTKLPHNESLTPTVKPDDVPPVNASSSFYDDIVYLHMDLNHHIHFTGLFLPWHRYFVHNLESVMKSKCNFKGSMPYWNWSIDASDVYNSDFFKGSNKQSGLGGWGNPDDDWQISDGAIGDITYAYPVPHRLRRTFTIQPFNKSSPFYPDPTLYANTTITYEEVSKTVNGFVGDYKGFQTYIEAFEGMHSAIHNIVNGDMDGICPANSNATYPGCAPGPKWSANDPLFYMHHAMLDKMWYDWQKINRKNTWAFEGGAVQMLQNTTVFGQYPNGGPPSLNLTSMVPGDGIFADVAISDVFSTKGGYLCYEYV